MRVILGIGNKGKKYENTRHNIGFMILDYLAEKYKLKFQPSKGDYNIAGSSKESSRFVLIKPSTFVNLSGVAAKQILEELNITCSDLLVISDDINLPSGKIRIRKSGGDGGHNGLASIIYHLESDQFARLRFGVSNDFQLGQMADYVLSEFSKEEFSSIKESINLSVSLIESFIEGGIELMHTTFSKINQPQNNSTNHKLNESN